MRRRAVKNLALLLTILMLLLSTAALQSGCGEGRPTEEQVTEAERPERPIPLRTFSQGSVCEYGRFEQPATGDETGPAFLVAGDEEEFRRILYLSGLEHPVERLDFSEQVVIAAFQGPRNTAGYAISIVRAVQEGEEVRVEVEIVEPEPGSITAQMLTSPYHLVVAEREDFSPRGELSFVFLEPSGEVLERIRMAI